jgi:hypothetical protein
MFGFARKRDAITAEAALDGIYIIRASVPPTQMDSADCVRNYKSRELLQILSSPEISEGRASC